MKNNRSGSHFLWKCYHNLTNRKGACHHKLMTSNREVYDWCTGTAQRDGMGREEGGGFGMGNTSIPVADSF